MYLVSILLRSVKSAIIAFDAMLSTILFLEKQLTSWEVLNHILVGLVKELVLLGVSPDIKRIALKLWAAYLKKAEVAFISKNLEKKPRLGVLFRRK